MFVQYLLVFLLGITVGSFLNVCICRIPAGKSVVFPPSQCASCGKRLGVMELVPVLSYFYLRGRCRSCGVPISWHYPLVELITGLLFVMTWLRFGWSWETIAGWVIVSILIVVTVTDLRHGIIPNKVIIAGFVMGMPLTAFQSWEALKLGGLAFLGAGLFMLAVAEISRGGMGGGDVKLSALMGLFLGPSGVVIALFLAFLAGGLVGAMLLITGVKKRKDPIPFGPFLAAGGLVALLWAERVAGWYWGFL